MGHRFLGGVLLAVLSIASLACLASGPGLRYPDEQQYLAIASSLAENGSFSLDGSTPTTFRPPGYPLLLAAFILLGCGVVQLKLVNAVALTLSTFLVHRYVRSVTGERAALIASALVLAYPVLFYTSSTLYPQTVGGTLFLLFLNLMFSGPVGAGRALLGSVVYGCLVLTIPGFAGLLVVVTPAVYLVHRGRRGLRSAVIVLAGVACVIGSWTLRNWMVSGVFVPISTNSGVVLLRGNSPSTGAASGVQADLGEHMRAARGLSEAERDRYFRTVAIRWVLDEPGAAARLYAAKLSNHFHYRNALHSQSEQSGLRSTVMFLSYYPLLGAAVARFLAARRFRLEPWEINLAILYLGFALTSAVFFTRIRFRLPLDFALMMLAGSLVGRVIDRSRGVRR